MSESVGIWAELTLPKDQVDAWWATTARGSAWKDWTGLLKDSGSTGRAEIRGTVKALIDEARKVGKKRSLFDLKVEDGGIHLRAVLSFDDDLSTCAEVSVAIRAAGPLGGKGDVVVMSLTDDRLNAHVTVAKTGGKCAKATLARCKSVFEALDAASAAHDEKASTPAAEMARTVRKMIEGNIKRIRDRQQRPELVALHERLLGAMVARCPPKEIVEAAKEWKRPYSARPPEMKTVDQIVEVFRTRLRDGVIGAPHFAPLDLLAHHDFAAAEAIAFELLELDIHWTACRIVSQSKQPRARDVLLRLLVQADDAHRGGPLEALMTMRDPAVGEAVLPRFEKALRDLPPYETQTPAAKELFQWCNILCANPYEPGYAAVARVYRDCRAELTRLQESVAVRRRETWDSLRKVPFVIFQQGPTWWVRKLVTYGKGEVRWSLGTNHEQAARALAVSKEKVALFAETLGKRLLFDGKPPGDNWRTAANAPGFTSKVEAVLKRRGL